MKGSAADAKRARAKAGRREKGTLRRYCTAHRLDRPCTLTYRARAATIRHRSDCRRLRVQQVGCVVRLGRSVNEHILGHEPVWSVCANWTAEFRWIPTRLLRGWISRSGCRTCRGATNGYRYGVNLKRRSVSLDDSQPSGSSRLRRRAACLFRRGCQRLQKTSCCGARGACHR